MVLTENILIRKETMMQIQNINEKSFKKYGKILTGYHVDGILAEMEHTPPREKCHMYRLLQYPAPVQGAEQGCLLQY